MSGEHYKNEVARLLSVKHNAKRAQRHYKDLLLTLKYLINEKNIRDKEIVNLYNDLQDNKDKISLLNKYIYEDRQDK